MVHHERYVQLKKGEAGVVSEDIKDQYSHNNIGPLLGLVCGNSSGGGGGFYNKRTRPKFFSLLLLSLLSCSLIVVPQFFFFPSTFSLLYSLGADGLVAETDAIASLCSSVPNGTVCCDRSSIRSDICIMKGDVRTKSASSSIFVYTSKYSNDYINYVSDRSVGDKQELQHKKIKLYTRKSAPSSIFVYTSNNSNDYINYVSDLPVGDKEELQHEKIKPYTRKWETSVMDTIDELDLISMKQNSYIHHRCDVKHDVPAVFFSTGGYTGNVYHEFNDGLVPLFITSQHLNKKVVFVILEYHGWWISKYGDILSLLSDYPPIDFSGDNRTHCFPEAIVGLRIHDELTVDSSLMEGNKSIKDFRDILDQAYRPRIRSIIQDEEQEAQLLKEKLALSPSSINSIEMNSGKNENEFKKPKLVIVSRNGSRAITNEDSLVKMAEQIGFFVEVLRPERTTELAKIYRALNSSDVMIGVHGAAMTHFLFMKPGSVFIQVVPLGTKWAAETYYGEPAKKLGLRYVGYEILPKESSLYEEYDQTNPVLRDPESVTKKGWEFTKKVYLDRQKVKLNLERFRKRLVRAYYCVAKKNLHFHPKS